MKNSPAVKVLAVVLSLLAIYLLWRNLFSSKSASPSRIPQIVQQGKQMLQEALPLPGGTSEEKKEFKVEEMINPQALLKPSYLFLPPSPPSVELMPELAYNPFKTSQPVAQIAQQEESSTSSFRLRLDAIINLKGRGGIAIINGKKYKEGDMVGPALIKKIEGNRVYLQTPMGETYLELFTDKREIEILLSFKEGEKK